MKYKLGDRVFIKPWELMVREFGVLDNFAATGAHIKQPRWPWCHYDEDRLAHTDRILTITHVENHYHGRHPLSEKLFVFDDDSVAGYAFDYGEEIMVWDDGKEPTYRKFVGFLYGRKSPYRTESFLDPKDCISWQHARPITKPDIKITVEINGEPKSLSEISEETLLNIRKESKC